MGIQWNETVGRKEPTDREFLFNPMQIRPLVAEIYQYYKRMLAMNVRMSGQVENLMTDKQLEMSQEVIRDEKVIIRRMEILLNNYANMPAPDVLKMLEEIGLMFVNMKPKIMSLESTL